MARKTFDEQEISAVTILLQIGCATLAICILNFFVGWLIGPRRRKLESSQLLGQKNTNFGMYLALCYATPLTAFGPIFYVLWHNLWNGAQLFLHDRRKTACRNENPDYIEEKTAAPEKTEHP